MKYPCIIKDFLRSHTASDFEGLITVATEISRIESLLRQRFDSEIAAQIRLGNIDTGAITLYTDSPAWASRLRFHTDEILREINKLYKNNEIQSIRINVLPKAAIPLAPALVRAPAQMAPAGRQLVEEMAETVSDPDLKAALERLARIGRT